VSFQFRNLQRLGNRVAVPVPKDENGFLGRECPQPECEGYFKIKPGTGLSGETLPCHCPYCGHTASHDHFWTKEQLEYAQSVVLRQITDAVRKDLKSLEFEHKPKGQFGIGFSMKLKPGQPIPIKYYREKCLETHVHCDSCTLEYAVFGVFAFCPDCGIHNSLQTLEKSLEVVRRQVSLASEVADSALRQQLTEDGLENCVSGLDGFGRECCRLRAQKSTNPASCDSVSFQNLPGVARRLQVLFGVDLEGAVSPEEWCTAHVGFMRRHLISHRAGVVDQKYLDETGESQALLGRRITISAADVIALAEIVSKLGRQLIAALPPIR
jgi:hypothetical protein